MAPRLAALLRSRSSWFDLCVLALGLGVVAHSSYRIVAEGISWPGL